MAYSAQKGKSYDHRWLSTAYCPRTSKGIKIIGTTDAPIENSFLSLPPPTKPITFYTPEKEIVRQKVNEWILHSGEFDAVVDLDQVLRDPNHPTQIIPAYDSDDHLHPNDAGASAEANAFPLALFDRL